VFPYWIWNLVNINRPFIGDVKENIVCSYSFFTTLLKAAWSNSLNSWNENSRVKLHIIFFFRRKIMRLQIMKHKACKNETLLMESNKFAQILPEYEINPFMQMCRYMLTFKSHLMLMNKISSIFSPRRKFHRIWKSI
jgi:hypothetical protein